MLPTLTPTLFCGVCGEPRPAEHVELEGRATLCGVCAIRAGRRPPSVAEALWEALYPFQRDGVGWLVGRAQGLLGDQMGLGKTVQALAAHPPGRALLVVCPASVKAVWLAEIRRWRPDLAPRALYGRQERPVWPDPGGVDAVVVNYDILPDERGAPPRGATLVADEAHYAKNPSAKRTKRTKRLVEAALGSGGRAWFLTGTPLMNRPPELWDLLKALGVRRDVFASWADFCRLFNRRWDHERQEWVWGEPGPEVAERLRRVMLRRRREEVLPDLPTKTYRDVRLGFALPAEVKEACDRAVADLRERGIDLADPNLDARSLADIERAMLASVHAARRLLAEAKIPTAHEIADDYEAAEEPLLVFSYHRGPVESLGARPGWAAILGGLPAPERARLVEEFQGGRLRGLALTIGAGGVGITLTRAAHLLYVDQAWTPAWNEQSEDRACRIGQTRGVLVQRLLADHDIDWRVAEILDRKRRLIDKTLGEHDQ